MKQEQETKIKEFIVRKLKENDDLTTSFKKQLMEAALYPSGYKYVFNYHIKTDEITSYPITNNSWDNPLNLFPHTYIVEFWSEKTGHEWDEELLEYYSDNPEEIDIDYVIDAMDYQIKNKQ